MVFERKSGVSVAEPVEAVEAQIIGDIMKGWMYILECFDGSYYTGSTNNLEFRIAQHQSREGANYTKIRLPVKLVYSEEFERIDDAFIREKQVQGWNRKKKEALINRHFDLLSDLAKNYTRKVV